MTSDKRPLNELIDEMLKEQNHNPKDHSFRLITHRYPKESHEIFNFPGKYADTLETVVHTEDGRNLYMDYAQLVIPDDEITCKTSINVEHQSTELNKNKIDSIYDYKIHLVHENYIPSLSIVVTNIKQEKSMKCYKSRGCVYNVYYIVIDENEISKRLKRLKNIIENKKKLSTADALNFAVIAIFVDGENKKEIMEKLTHLFTKIGKIDQYLELNLHWILKKMIKKHFEDDIEKTKELLKMISKNLYKTNYEGLTGKQIDELRIQKREEIITRINKELEQQYQQQEQKDQQHKQEIEQKDQQIEQKDQQIEQLKQKDQQHKQEIEQLKQQIAKQNRIN